MAEARSPLNRDFSPVQLPCLLHVGLVRGSSHGQGCMLSTGWYKTGGATMGPFIYSGRLEQGSSPGLD